MPKLQTINYKTVSPKYALERNYDRVTHGYSKAEHWMLESAIADMHGLDYLLVMEIDGIAIYRKRSEINRFKVDHSSLRA